MKIIAENTDGERIVLKNISELCFTQSAGVACDSLWLSLFSDFYIGEIKQIIAYHNNILIFNGFCDCQKNSENEKGYEISLFARSSACILVDNETVPYTYEKPSAKQLCHCIAKKYGFICELPEIYSDFKYQVSAGSSCYGAISRFVSLLTDGFIYVTPKNEICLQKLSGSVKSLNSYDVLSAVRIFNRSEPVSKITFKKSADDARYNMHTEIHPDISMGAEREMYINLSSLPRWQRDNTVLKKLRESYENYDVIELTVAGYAEEGLMQLCSFATDRHRYENYYLAEKKFMLSQKGEFTKLILRKNIGFKEITYVDK